MLAERFQCTHAVGKLKARHRLPFRDQEREAAQISRLRHLTAASNLDPVCTEKFIVFVIREVIRHHELAQRGSPEDISPSEPGGCLHELRAIERA
jgi:chorismate mutase